MEGFMTSKGFQAFFKTRQVLLSTLFNTQKAIQKGTLSIGTWETIASRSVLVHPGRNTTVRNLQALVSISF